ncbi:phosphate acyltransferase [Desulfovibrio sp. 86]|uniref:Phosphate butyryltransferase n=1 Tax=uncultured Desulfovibrio sp. TaxID=167968 RepID=A0A212LAQ8_9BACT|nr:phosphate acyltransferase [Desulfovibrio sp. 86]SCM74409.1 Phosphate butyryltransferase [uncultured Desulfovibrio sp.]VZH34817.1 Phosphate butyryltransferase [Desulfovibrio sp. 86]
MIYHNFDELLAQAAPHIRGGRTLAVVRPEDPNTLEAVVEAKNKGGLESILVGDKNKIAAGLRGLGHDPDSFAIVSADSDEDAVFTAADLVNEGKAHVIMKGLIETPILMKNLFKERCNFRTGKLISHICFVQIPSYHKIVALSDIALNIAPTLEQKRDILENAVDAMLRMGFDKPMVAVLAANEHVSEKMPETVDAAALKTMNQDGVIKNCVVEGPLSYDLAISPKVAAIKKCTSPVPGNVDLMIMPNISAGNILLKSLVYSAGAHRAGIVVGGRVPMVLPSRAAVAEDKYLPMLLAAAAG